MRGLRSSHYRSDVPNDRVVGILCPLQIREISDSHCVRVRSLSLSLSLGLSQCILRACGSQIIPNWNRGQRRLHFRRRMSAHSDAKWAWSRDTLVGRRNWFLLDLVSGRKAMKTYEGNTWVFGVYSVIDRSLVGSLSISANEFVRYVRLLLLSVRLPLLIEVSISFLLHTYMYIYVRTEEDNNINSNWN